MDGGLDPPSAGLTSGTGGTPQGDSPGTCVKSTECLQPGETLIGGSVCCSGVVNADGTCGRTLLGCRAENKVCSSNGDCCGNLCEPNGSGVSVCKAVGGCDPLGEPCNGPSQCCSAACLTLAPGSMFCVPIGGCKPIGELWPRGHRPRGGAPSPSRDSPIHEHTFRYDESSPGLAPSGARASWSRIALAD
jgi:hypothetical protein